MGNHIHAPFDLRQPGIAGKPFVKPRHEASWIATECYDPIAKLDHIKPTVAQFDFAHKGLPLAKCFGKLKLRQASLKPSLPKLLQEEHVVAGVPGGLHRQWRYLPRASNPT